jgi:hypothetical protein
VRPDCDPAHRLIIAHSERALVTSTSDPTHHRAHKSRSGCGIEEMDRDRVVEHAAQPRGVIAQPSAPQFSSSHLCISVSRVPSPPRGTPSLIRQGKRRSASAVISLEVAAMDVLCLSYWQSAISVIVLARAMQLHGARFDRPAFSLARSRDRAGRRCCRALRAHIEFRLAAVSTTPNTGVARSVFRAENCGSKRYREATVGIQGPRPEWL